jgi:alcohol dehydrogenase
MHAIVLHQPGRLEKVPTAEPPAPGPGEALVRVHRVGICGTDVAGFLGKMPFFSYPRIMGHELGVEVLEVGPGVTGVQRGDRCCVEPYLNCQQCFACRRGHSNCCQRLQVLGVHTDGGLRPRIVVPARKLHRAEGLSWEQLALVETLGIGCHAVARAKAQAGEHAAVIGAGPIGLAVAEFLRLAQVCLVMLDVNPRRLEFCRSHMGLERTLLCTGDARDIDDLKNLCGGELPTLVMDATGSKRSMCRAFELVAHAGRLVFVGITAEEIHFPDPLLHARELSVLGSRNALPGDLEHILGLIAQGRLDTRPWITHRSTFDELVENFPAYTRPETGVVKAMVEVDQE